MVSRTWLKSPAIRPSCSLYYTASPIPLILTHPRSHREIHFKGLT